VCVCARERASKRAREREIPDARMEAGEGVQHTCDCHLVAPWRALAVKRDLTPQEKRPNTAGKET